MGKAETITGIPIRASDVSGQKIVDVKNAPPDATVGELLKELVVKMQLPENEPYQVKVPRLDRRLMTSERVGDALQPGDHVTLEPNIEAGAK